MKKIGLVASLLLIGGLTGCFSKPDISGTWIPEKTPNSAYFYAYYEISKPDSNGNFAFKKVNYQIKNMNPYNPAKLPKFNGESKGVLTPTKDNTYCVEGSLNTECFIFTDGKLRPSNSQEYLVKSPKAVPDIPVRE